MGDVIQPSGRPGAIRVDADGNVYTRPADGSAGSTLVAGQQSAAIPSGQTGSPIYTQRWPCTITLVCSGSSGKVQYTTSSAVAVVAGTATWQDWSRGVISATASDIPEGPITGVRGVSSSGTVTLEVVQ